MSNEKKEDKGVPKKEDIIEKGTITIHKAFLVCNNTVIQISSICSIWKRKLSVPNKKPESIARCFYWGLVLIVLGGPILAAMLCSKYEVFALPENIDLPILFPILAPISGLFVFLSVILLCISVIKKCYFKPWDHYYLLAIEKSSGRTEYIGTLDGEDFINTVMNAIIYAFTQKVDDKPITINLDNRKIDADHYYEKIAKQINMKTNNNE